MIGAQDCRNEAFGARTGDINADMVANLGAKFVILGHSERRQHYGESNELVHQKVKGAWAAGLIAVVCVGEIPVFDTPEDAIEIVYSQLQASLPDGVTADNTVIAYERRLGNRIRPKA